MNAFDYGDPAPTEAALAVRAESGVRTDDAPGSQVVRVAVTARDLAADERPSVNLTLVVDRSGSMAMGNRTGTRPRLARPADPEPASRRHDLGGRLRRQVELVVPPTPVEDREAIIGALASLTPRGSTDVEGGLSLGYEQAREAYRPGGINVVVLCSDGVANVGLTGPESIAARIAEEGRNGIHLVTVGYGMGSYNDHLMEQLADQGDGFYRYVDTYEEAQQSRRRADQPARAGRRRRPHAGRARSERVASYRLIGYENRAMDDDSFEDLGADAGELGAGHHASALYEVRLAEGVEPGDLIGSATVLWKTPGTDEPVAASAQLYAADPEVPMPDSLALALPSRTSRRSSRDPVSDRPTSLDDVRSRAAALASRGVPGAADLAALAERLSLVR